MSTSRVRPSRRHHRRAWSVAPSASWCVGSRPRTCHATSAATSVVSPRSGRAPPPTRAVAPRGQVLTMRSAGTSASAAFSHPLPSHSSCPGRVGVGVDRDHASRRHGGPQEGVGGIEAFGPRIDLDGRARCGHTPRTPRRGRSAIRPGPARRRCRPVQWPRMSVWGLSMAATMRRRHLRRAPS